jgi:D-proline reductase (dithiol) PrdB
VQSPLRWSPDPSPDPSWKCDDANAARLSPEELRRRREEFDRQKEIAKTIRGAPA